ncbi:hypothetical protein [Pseudonocardia endophytica]|uniref:Uncharacterized protein n=1 Tax=Pseudonocardia endophytica TaxID=401976 RepID=A0A4V2PJ84_PSEEN|nr:hypothetical protein [Pseudonocardia endophytica]TCK27556.1 hypothetical protein EV378_3428 [Pseudonocardia endophytica]
MDDLDELWAALDRIAATPHLVVACGFDGGLAPDLGDPANARAEQQSSEALNVLLALPRTTVAVVSRRDPDEVAELMLLSGSKGGLRHIPPEDVAKLRDEVGADVAVVVGAGDEAPRDLRPGDLAITVLTDSDDGADEPGPGFVVDDTERVGEVLEELARLRRDT